MLRKIFVSNKVVSGMRSARIQQSRGIHWYLLIICTCTCKAPFESCLCVSSFKRTDFWTCKSLNPFGPFKDFLLIAGNGFIFKDTVEVVAVEDPDGKLSSPYLNPGKQRGPNTETVQFAA